MPKPYTIRLFVPEGDPNTFKIIDKMNWTGIGLEVSREAWGKHKNRKEFEQAGIYILFGYQEGEDLPTLYIGQGDGVKSRIESHEKSKAFWDKVLVFVSSNSGLNRAHITWLEWALIQQARLTPMATLKSPTCGRVKIPQRQNDKFNLIFANRQSFSLFHPFFSIFFLESLLAASFSR